MPSADHSTPFPVDTSISTPLSDSSSPISLPTMNDSYPHDSMPNVSPSNDAQGTSVNPTIPPVSRPTMNKALSIKFQDYNGLPSMLTNPNQGTAKYSKVCFITAYPIQSYLCYDKFNLHIKLFLPLLTLMLSQKPSLKLFEIVIGKQTCSLKLML